MKPTGSKKNCEEANQSAATGPSLRRLDGATPHELVQLLTNLEPLIVACLNPAFDAEDLRIIKKLGDWEWNFSGLDPDDDVIVDMAARHEYMREISGYYEVARELYGMFLGRVTPASFTEKWKWRTFFPMQEMVHFRMPLTTCPWMLIQEFFHPKCEDEPYRVVKEIGADDVSPIWSGETRHRIEIDWNCGIETVQSDLVAWVRSVVPKDVPSSRGRPKRKRIEDGLAQLAAWRASRAGLSVRQFNELLDNAGIKVPRRKGSREFVRRYADSSAYRTAAAAAEKRIKETKTDYQSLWNKTVEKNRDYWADRCQVVRNGIQRMTDEAEAFRVRMEQKKREAELFLQQLEKTQRMAKGWEEGS